MSNFLMRIYDDGMDWDGMEWDGLIVGYQILLI